MILNILNKDQSNASSIKLTSKEFWKLYLKIKPNNLTEKEIDIASDFLSGNPKPIKGNYKTYVKKIKEKNFPLEKRKVPKNITIQINIEIDELS